MCQLRANFVPTRANSCQLGNELERVGIKLESSWNLSWHELARSWNLLEQNGRIAHRCWHNVPTPSWHEVGTKLERSWNEVGTSWHGVGTKLARTRVGRFGQSSKFRPIGEHDRDPEYLDNPRNSCQLVNAVSRDPDLDPDPDPETTRIRIRIRPRPVRIWVWSGSGSAGL